MIDWARHRPAMAVRSGARPPTVSAVRSGARLPTASAVRFAARHSPLNQLTTGGPLSWGGPPWPLARHPLTRGDVRRVMCALQGEFIAYVCSRPSTVSQEAVRGCPADRDRHLSLHRHRRLHPASLRLGDRRYAEVLEEHRRVLRAAF